MSEVLAEIRSLQTKPLTEEQAEAMELSPRLVKCYEILKNAAKRLPKYQATAALFDLLEKEHKDLYHALYFNAGQYGLTASISISSERDVETDVLPLLKLLKEQGWRPMRKPRDRAEDSTRIYDFYTGEAFDSRFGADNQLSVHVTFSGNCRYVETGEYTTVPVRKLVCDKALPPMTSTEMEIVGE